MHTLPKAVRALDLAPDSEPPTVRWVPHTHHAPPRRAAAPSPTAAWTTPAPRPAGRYSDPVTAVAVRSSARPFVDPRPRRARGLSPIALVVLGAALALLVVAAGVVVGAAIAYESMRPKATRLEEVRTYAPRSELDDDERVASARPVPPPVAASYVGRPRGAAASPAPDATEVDGDGPPMPEDPARLLDAPLVP